MLVFTAVPKGSQETNGLEKNDLQDPFSNQADDLGYIYLGLFIALISIYTQCGMLGGVGLLPFRNILDLDGRRLWQNWTQLLQDSLGSWSLP